MRVKDVGEWLIILKSETFCDSEIRVYIRPPHKVFNPGLIVA